MIPERPILIELPEELVGERVLVRPYRDADAVALFEAVTESVDHLRPWMPWATSHGSVDDSREFIRRSQSAWALREELIVGIFLRDDGGFLGGSGLHLGDWSVPSFEIGYWVRRTAEGSGYVTEAAGLLMEFAFETLRAERLVIRCDARNRRSAAIPARLGFRLEGTARHDARNTAGELTDTQTFSMIRADYEDNRSGLEA